MYTAQPRDPKQTKVKGYMTNPNNIIYTERVEMSVGVKPNIQGQAGVILDLTAHTVIKNKFNPSANFEDVVKYYCQAYPDYLREAGFTLEEPSHEPTDVQAVQTQEEESGRPASTAAPDPVGSRQDHAGNAGPDQPAVNASTG
jgi:hypothetical protein